MFKWLGRLSFGGQMLLLVIAGIISFVAADYYSKPIKQEHARLIRTYLTDNKCVKTGFIGEYPQSIYRCTTGLWLYDQISDMTNPR